MVGFRAAGWTLCAAAVLSVLVTFFGLRGIGIVGAKGNNTDLSANVGEPASIELTVLDHRTGEMTDDSAISTSHNLKA